MKGILLAGGIGSRLWPSTQAISKHLIPIYDKPMIFYPLSVLMLAEIREVVIVSTPEHKNLFESLFGTGRHLGMEISHVVQPEPKGIADAILCVKEFIGENSFCLILGDNIFYGPNFREKLLLAKNRQYGATIFGYHVKDPKQFGVIDFGDDGNPQSIVEKPAYPKSNVAVTGLYFFDNKAVEFASNCEPSIRGELEINSVISNYIENQTLTTEILGRGFAWLDTGTPSAMLEAAQFIETLERLQGYKIACIEEIAFNNSWIGLSEIKNLTSERSSNYSSYLTSLIS